MKNSKKKWDVKKPMRNFFFTDYHANTLAGKRMSDYREIFFKHRKNIVYWVFQREPCSEGKNMHMQCYMELRKPQRMSWLHKILEEKVHVEERKGTRLEARYYCMKDADGIWDDKYQWPDHKGRQDGDEYYELGEWRKGQGNRTDLDLCHKMLKENCSMLELWDENFGACCKYYKGFKEYRRLQNKEKSKKFRNVTVTVIHGTAGTGKSKMALYDKNLKRHPDTYVLETSNGSNLWFNDYEGEKRLVINDFYGWIKYGTLLNILDGHQQNLEEKGSNVYALWDEVVITSNVSPGEWYGRGVTAALKRRINKVVTL